MQKGVDRGIFPGAVLQVLVGGKTVYRRAFGFANLFSGRAMGVDTCFDLASLTKPLATVPAVMVLVQKGLLDLDRPCGEIVSELSGSDKGRITCRQLLRHRSGLAAWRPFYMRLRHVAEASRLSVLRRWLQAEPLIWAPGERSEYSDVGFMLLQWIVETISGQRLDRFAAREIYEPLGVEALFFNDAFRDASGGRVYAATQLCPWRNRLMVGQVDDDNAYVIGGVAGHAGLFGTADGVCRLLAVMLAADRGDDTSGVFEPVVVRSFFKAPVNERWALGFDTPCAEGSSAGRYFPADSVGHLGFTGTSFWMHRAGGIIVALLTNRVHPFRFNAGIKAFRPALHDAVMRSAQSGDLGTVDRV